MVLSEEKISELEKFLTEKYKSNVEEEVETKNPEEQGIKRLVYSKNVQNQ
jgi:hypothetical protein